MIVSLYFNQDNSKYPKIENAIRQDLINSKIPFVVTDNISQSNIVVIGQSNPFIFKRIPKLLITYDENVKISSMFFKYKVYLNGIYKNEYVSLSSAILSNIDLNTKYFVYYNRTQISLNSVNLKILKNQHGYLEADTFENLCQKIQTADEIFPYELKYLENKYENCQSSRKLYLILNKNSEFLYEKNFKDENLVIRYPNETISDLLLGKKVIEYIDSIEYGGIMYDVYYAYSDNINFNKGLHVWKELCMNNDFIKELYVKGMLKKAITKRNK